MLPKYNKSALLAVIALVSLAALAPSCSSSDDSGGGTAGTSSGGKGGTSTGGTSSGGKGGTTTTGGGGATAGGTGGAATGGGGATAGGTGGTNSGGNGTTAGTGGAAAGTGGTGGTTATPCGGCADLKSLFSNTTDSVSLRIDFSNTGVDLAGAVVTASVKIVTGEPNAGIQLYLQDIGYGSDYPYVSIGSFQGDTASFHDVVTTVPSVAPDGGTLPYDVHHVKQLVFQLNSGSVVPATLEVLIDKITITGAPAVYGPYTFDSAVTPLVGNGGSAPPDGGVAATPVLTWVP